MTTLARYLSVRLLLTSLGIAFVLTALVQILDLLDTTEDILETHQGAKGFAFYIVMRLPSIIPEVIPLSVLIGALFSLAMLVRNGEIVAMRAAGLRIEQFLLAMTPAVVALAIAHYAVSDWLRPPAERNLAAWWVDNAVDDDAPVWLNADGTIVLVNRVRDRGRRLENIEIYAKDETAAIASQTVAGTATYDNGEWRLANATQTDWRRGQTYQSRPANGPWATRLRPSNVLEALVPGSRVSAGAARDALIGQRLAINAPSVYETALQRAFAEPATNFVMLLLAMPLAFANWRASQTGRFFLFAIGAGLLFLLTDGLAATLAQAGIVRPVLGAWAPSFVFGILGFSLLKRLNLR